MHLSQKLPVRSAQQGESGDLCLSLFASTLIYAMSIHCLPSSPEQSYVMVTSMAVHKPHEEQSGSSFGTVLQAANLINGTC